MDFTIASPRPEPSDEFWRAVSARYNRSKRAQYALAGGAKRQPAIFGDE
jgi:hypothetical protein